MRRYVVDGYFAREWRRLTWYDAKVNYRRIAMKMAYLDAHWHASTDGAEKASGADDSQFSYWEKLVSLANRICYNALADEYETNHHRTCRDFDSVNRQFVQNRVASLVGKQLRALRKRQRVLEIGPGPGHLTSELMSLFKEEEYQYDVVDISPRMLERCGKAFGDSISNYFCGSIFELAPKLQGKYDVVFALLSDPYLTSNTLRRIGRILSPGGVLVLSYPAHSWARVVRSGSFPFTFFRNVNGRRLFSFSFCWPLDDLIGQCSANGLFVDNAAEWPINGLVQMSITNRRAELAGGPALSFLSTLILRKANGDPRNNAAR